MPQREAAKIGGKVIGQGNYELRGHDTHCVNSCLAIGLGHGASFPHRRSRHSPSRDPAREPAAGAVHGAGRLRALPRSSGGALPCQRRCLLGLLPTDECCAFALRRPTTFASPWRPRRLTGCRAVEESLSLNRRSDPLVKIGDCVSCPHKSKLYLAVSWDFKGLRAKKFGDVVFCRTRCPKHPEKQDRRRSAFRQGFVSPACRPFSNPSIANGVSS